MVVARRTSATQNASPNSGEKTRGCSPDFGQKPVGRSPRYFHGGPARPAAQRLQGIHVRARARQHRPYSSYAPPTAATKERRTGRMHTQPSHVTVEGRVATRSRRAKIGNVRTEKLVLLELARDRRFRAWESSSMSGAWTVMSRTMRAAQAEQLARADLNARTIAG